MPRRRFGGREDKGDSEEELPEGGVGAPEVEELGGLAQLCAVLLLVPRGVSGVLGVGGFGFGVVVVVEVVGGDEEEGEVGLELPFPSWTRSSCSVAAMRGTRPRLSRRWLRAGDSEGPLAKDQR